MADRIVKEWKIHYELYDGEGGLREYFIVLPSVRKVLWWFLTRGRRAARIYIWTSGRIA